MQPTVPPRQAPAGTRRGGTAHGPTISTGVPTRLGKPAATTNPEFPMFGDEAVVNPLQEAQTRVGAAPSGPHPESPGVPSVTHCAREDEGNAERAMMAAELKKIRRRMASSFARRFSWRR